jgi:DNA primase
VVEGYLDVIALTQYDIPGAVATMGTATNEDSLQRLLSLSDRITFCFDGDSAGVSAARKAMEKILPFLEDGHRIAFLLLPDGEDPDTHVRRIGSKRMSEALEQALPMSLFLFRVLGQNLDLALAEDKSLLFKRGKALLATMNRQKAPTLLNGLREDLWKATREQYQQGRYQSKKPVTTLSFANLMQSFNGFTSKPAGSAGPREATMLARSLAVGLLKNPGEASRMGLMAELDVDAESERDAIALADWIESNGLATTGDLLYALAANPELAARLEYLFDVSELDGSLSTGVEKSAGQRSDEQERQTRQLLDTIEQMRRNYTRSTLARIEHSLRLRPDDADLKARYRRLMTELSPRGDR